MKASLIAASGHCPRRASTATCFLVVLLGPLAASPDARAGSRGWQGDRDAGQTRTVWRMPATAAATTRLPERALRATRATAVMGIRG